MIEIEAAVATAPGEPFRLERLRLGPIRDDEVLVRIAGAGICHTDLLAIDGFYPIALPAVFGHEGAGVVEQVGASVRRLAVGDHVVLTMDTCGRCRHCQEGAPTYCDERAVLNFTGYRPDGSCALAGDVRGHFFGQSSFASHAVAHERNAIRVPTDLPLHLLGPLGCGIQTGAGAILNVLRPGAGSSLAVFGCGAVGLAAVMAGRLSGCATIVAIDRHQSRLDLAVELGATAAVAAGDDVVAEVVRLTGRGADHAVEATGSPAVLRQAVDATRIRGSCCLVGNAPAGTDASLEMLTLLRGRTLRGSIEGDSVPELFIPLLADLYRRGQLPLGRLVTTYPLAAIDEAVADARAGRTVKPVLLPG